LVVVMVVTWGFCYGWRRCARGGVLAGPARGMRACRSSAAAWWSSCRAVTGARHLGLLALRSASGLGLAPGEGRPAPTAFNRAG